MLTRFALVLLAVGSAPQAASLPQPPNVLFLVVDDASWEEFTGLALGTVQIGVSGARTYDHFYSSPSCPPTRYQFHFGRYPHDELIGKQISPVSGTGAPTGNTSLAEVLTTRGYATGMFGKWHLNGEKLPLFVGEAPRLHGYSTWHAGSVGNVTSTGGSHYNWERWDDGAKVLENTYSTHAIGNAVTDWWRETEGPKFAVCAFLAPHAPFEMAPLDLLAGQSFPATDRGRYESALVAIDSKIRQMVQALDLSNTYVFLFADNGTPPQVPPPSGLEKGYKLSEWEGGINVPLLVWGPGVVAGKESGLVQAVDLPATVLELAGIQAPHGALEDSISFAQTLAASGPSVRPWVWSQLFSPNGGSTTGSLLIDEWAILRSDGWKLVQHHVPAPYGPKVKELYNVFTDPHETTSVVDATIQNQLLLLRQEALGPDWPY